VTIEWIEEWSPHTEQERPDVAEAVSRFQAPAHLDAGRAATEWLRERAASAHPGCVTRILLSDNAVQGYYSLSMSEVRLSHGDRRKLDETHPRQGAVLITWLARAEDATVADVAQQLLLHAVGVAREHAYAVGATVLALDPFDDSTAEMWREKYGFRSSQTERPGRPPRMWKPLFPRA
jgi:hypothetical protein